MSLSEALRAIINNPDDLSQLPQLVEQVHALEQAEFTYQERIAKLQDINKSYLAQIPITTAADTPAEPEEAPPATLADAREHFINHFKEEK